MVGRDQVPNREIQLGSGLGALRVGRFLVHKGIFVDF